MATLLRNAAARRIGGYVVQPARAVVADERRRLGPRFIHTKQSAGEDIKSHVQRKKEGEKIRLEKWRERRLAFQRYDEAFTNFLHTAFGGIFGFYAILACKDSLVEKWGAQTDEK